MPGRINEEDVAQVKERASIEDVVREHVTLRAAGPGRLKGLCPFHDEKTPSFTVRPAVGAWHCFGCNEGGDVLSFVMKVEHIGFGDAVERLAGQVGVHLRYEEGGPRHQEGAGRRARLVEAHRVAQERCHELLLASPEARPARDFLRERGFDSAAAARFGVGYAPRGGDELTRWLRGKGFAEDELVVGGLSARGRRGLYDRFRGRLLWPIRDITGDTVGFGARRLYDDDRVEAKYLNTAESPIYRKSSVLYGLDLAKRSIAKERQVVVVEGYTDVMACHLAGLATAVATCGTAFGAEHITVLRRILRDEAGGTPARVVFTFDGDAAGQKAAMRAFAEDQRWASQSYVAVAPGGMDPCELRQREGDAAVRALVAEAAPMFEFAVRTTLARFDLTAAEGRVRAMAEVAPMVAQIRDRALRPEYTRIVAGWIGVEVEQVAQEVARAGRAVPKPAAGQRPGAHAGHAGAAAPRSGGPDVGAGVDEGEPGEGEPGEGEPGAGEPGAGEAGWPVPDLRDPAVDLERQGLQLLLQHPTSVPEEDLGELTEAAFTAAAHRAVFAAVRAQQRRPPATSAAAWVAAVAAAAGPSLTSLVSELSVAPIKARMDPADGRPDPRYTMSVLVGLRELELTRRIAEVTSALRRAEGGEPAVAKQIAVELTGQQRRLADLKERLS